MTPRRNAQIPHLSDAADYVDFFTGLNVSTAEGLDQRRLPGGLQKTYILETSERRSGTTTTEWMESLLRKKDLTAQAVGPEKDLFRIVDQHLNGLALLEVLDRRYLAMYTLLPSQEADKLGREMVADNSSLDSLWLSSEAFHSLWRHVEAVNNPNRYTRITFEHESIFETAADPDAPELEDERRASRFTMVDRIHVIKEQMLPLSRAYAPLSSITSLRVPSAGTGGHDVFFNGKVTNRSNSFLDHRSTIIDVVDMYRDLTRSIESKLWLAAHDENGAPRLGGAVAELVFSEELSCGTFKRWIDNMFGNPRNRFRISGFPTWLSDAKVHANAIDQHLWQPIVMELTTRRVVAVLPSGTCGNTINRLVSNVQRFIDPKVTAYIGAMEYSSMVPEVGVA